MPRISPSRISSETLMMIFIFGYSRRVIRQSHDSLLWENQLFSLSQPSHACICAHPSLPHYLWRLRANHFAIWSLPTAHPGFVDRTLLLYIPLHRRTGNVVGQSAYKKNPITVTLFFLNAQCAYLKT
jgi:hypothetical protein